MNTKSQEAPISGRGLFEGWWLVVASALLVGSVVFVFEARRAVAGLLLAKGGNTRGIYLDIPLWEYVFLAAHIWLVVAVAYALRRPRARRTRSWIVLAAYALVLGAGHCVGIWAARAGIHLGWLPWAMKVFP